MEKLIRSNNFVMIINEISIDARMYLDSICVNICRAWRKRVRLGYRVEVP